MTLPNLTYPNQVVRLDVDRDAAVIARRFDHTVCVTINHNGVSVGVDLHAWDAAALGAVLLGLADAASPVTLAAS